MRSSNHNISASANFSDRLTYSNEVKRGLGLFYHCSLSINKLIKIINGNRRKTGYIYTQWNIDKGLFSQGKLEYIKTNYSETSLMLFA